MYTYAVNRDMLQILKDHYKLLVDKTLYRIMFLTGYTVKSSAVCGARVAEHIAQHASLWHVIYH